ncbi:hypothetical protein [Thalassospira lucentensis]|uniref:hypothetical protein n=1 Tax=Thalassospira lucentensis TaxID=168935 RepID=UPI003AA97B07
MMLEQERNHSEDISETTPSEISEYHRSFCRTFSDTPPVFVPVIEDTHGLYGWCCDGVSEKIKSDEGEHAFGWTIWEWPNVLLTAEFHDVWKSPDGVLYDITPKPNGEQQILFVHDATFHQDFNFDHRPRNKRVRTYTSQSTDEIVLEKIAQMSQSQRAYEEKRAIKNSLSLEDWIAEKLDDDPMPGLIDDMIAICNEHEKHFDSLGASGHVQADQKLLKLMEKRLKTQNRLKAALARTQTAP